MPTFLEKICCFLFTVSNRSLSEPVDSDSAQEQKPSGLEGVMECRQYLLLQVLFEINQQIAATDRVHLREGRITQKILPSEQNHLAEELGDAVVAVLLAEEPAQPFPREVMDDA